MQRISNALKQFNLKQLGARNIRKVITNIPLRKKILITSSVLGSGLYLKTSLATTSGDKKAIPLSQKEYCPPSYGEYKNYFQKKDYNGFDKLCSKRSFWDIEFWELARTGNPAFFEIAYRHYPKEIDNHLRSEGNLTHFLQESFFANNLEMTQFMLEKRAYHKASNFIKNVSYPEAPMFEDHVFLDHVKRKRYDDHETNRYLLARYMETHSDLSDLAPILKVESTFNALKEQGKLSLFTNVHKVILNSMLGKNAFVSTEHMDVLINTFSHHHLSTQTVLAIINRGSCSERDNDIAIKILTKYQWNTKEIHVMSDEIKEYLYLNPKLLVCLAEKGVNLNEIDPKTGTNIDFAFRQRLHYQECKPTTTECHGLFANLQHMGTYQVDRIHRDNKGKTAEELANEQRRNCLRDD